jgi:hypothetical protein
MNTKQVLVQIAAIVATGWMIAPAAHANTAQEGVQCPSGSSATISNGERKLVCESQERVERASVCSPIVFKSNGDINLNQRIEMIEAGSDTCRAVTTGATAPSQAALLPGDNPLDFHREVRAGADVFVFIKKTYKFPEGGPIYVGDASKGVQCETGYDGDARFSGRGIRCDRKETRKATCDLGWTVDRNTGTDKCFIEQVVFGNKVRVDGQYTIPEGTTGVLGNPETHGWNLLKDFQGSTDFWQKESTDFAFPKSSL